MYAFIEIVIALLAGLFRFLARHARAVFGLAVGAGIGLAFGLSLVKYGGVNRSILLMFVVIGAAVIAPAIIGFLEKLSPKP